MKDIKQILVKYYKGETSIDEELQLKEYLRQDNSQRIILRQAQDDLRQTQDDFRKDQDDRRTDSITNDELGITDNGSEIDDLNFEKAMFDYFESEQKNQLGEEFDEKILNKITSQKIKHINHSRNKVYYRLAGIAAIVLFAIGYYFIFYSSNFNEIDKINLTENEKFALEQTIETLTSVSVYLNVANDEMEGLSIINNSLETINKVSDFEQYNKYILNILGEGT